MAQTNEQKQSEAKHRLLLNVHRDDHRRLLRESPQIAAAVEAAVRAGLAPIDIRNMFRARFGYEDQRVRLIVSAAFSVMYDHDGIPISDDADVIPFPTMPPGTKRVGK